MPFGPRASRPTLVELESQASVRPDDFWGEDSAAIHEVLQGPEAGVGDPSPIPGDDSSGAAAPAQYARLRERLGAWRLHASLVVARVSRTWRARVRSRPVAIVAGGIAAVACSAIAVGSVQGGHGGPVFRASARANAPAAWAQPARDPGLLTAAKRQGLELVTSHHTAATAHATASHRAPSSGRRGSVRSLSSSGSPRSGSADRSSPPPPTPPPPTYAATSTPSTSLGSGTGATAASASGGSGAGDSGVGGTSQSAGPEGPGAPFGPVHSS